MLTKSERMRPWSHVTEWSFCASLVIFLLSSSSYATDTIIQAAIGHPDRVEADVVRDRGRMPVEVLQFFRVAESARVIEIGAGGGYYTELLSRVVGKDGLVYAYNPFPFLQFITDEISARYSTGKFPNVVMGIGSLFALDIRDNAFDAAYFIDTYHDIAYEEITGEAISRPALATLKEIRRILKPGAIVGVVDHRAKDDAKRADAAKIHRIAESVLRRDFRDAGFVMLGSADFLTNPLDDRSQAWFSDPKFKDATDRMVLRFQNPK